MTPSLNQANNKANIRSNSQQANNTLRPLSSQTYIPQQKLNLYKDRTRYQKPEEELAQLEAELKAEEERELQEKGYYHPINYKYQLKKIDFKKYGNEWAAMAAYDKKLYEQQLLDERIRTTQQKKNQI